jgi:hypothetical protein
MTKIGLYARYMWSSVQLLAYETSRFGDGLGLILIVLLN